MHDKDHKNTCMACSCPCDMHKKHIHGEEHDEEKEGGTCKACSGDEREKHTCGC